MLWSPKIRIPKQSSRLMIRLRGFFHRVVLARISIWYCKYCDYFGIPYLASHNLSPLPFNTVIKWGHRVREDEALAIELAHSLGLPAPRLLSYGANGYSESYGSIWMTVLPGKPLSMVWHTLSGDEKRTIVGEIDQCILRMRQCQNPNSLRVSSLTGSHILSYRASDGLIKPCRDEDELLDYLMSVRNPRWSTPEKFAASTERVKSIAKIHHSIVFTHGDLFQHNMLVKDGHLSGIIDWECAGWLPEYWDYTTMSIRGYDVKPPLEWQALLYANPGFIYSEELEADYELCILTHFSWPLSC